jgi:hypothetical protein
MPWGRLDDRGNGDAKLLALSDAAWRMWGCGLIYCQFNLTDGFIPQHAIDTFGVRAKNKRVVAEELCQSLVPGKGPLWHPTEGGYQVHDYLDWNESKETIEKERALSKQRVDRFRKRRGNAVTSRVTNDEQTPTERLSTTTTTDERFEDQNRPSRAHGLTGSGAMAGALQRDHLRHVGPCGRVCVPEVLHGALVRQLGGDAGAADTELRAFYRRVLAGIPDAQPIGDEPFTFWRKHFAAAYASAAPAAAMASRGPSHTPAPLDKYAGIGVRDDDAE